MQPHGPCDGLCVSGADVGVPEFPGIAYAHPGCPMHAPGQKCTCDSPLCNSYTHERDAAGNRTDLVPDEYNWRWTDEQS